ncbi:hypothetical protein LB523_12000 [Mesorhizobium sp. ESP-6-4]|uniref:hypothetical protein n=1 Tax=Mesorhizobium sp. ESP-6-4 TaxID=2876624 RepID=UPI001CCF68CB|nr:hypothetical protein [Mesorhizobium sp. ESP-6-4]MBZ9659768.1 hypothetical protein [Mesorhizobium sp. ESP-6-4]
MATVDTAPDGFDAGVPVLGTPALVLIHATVPDSLASGTPDLGLPVIIILYEVWPFRPLLPIQETLEWLTDVLPSRTGEQRIALRSSARQMFAFGSRLTDAQFAKARTLAIRRAHSPIGVPAWVEETTTAAVTAGDTTIAIDTTAGDWRVNEGIVIYQDSDTYETALVTAVAVDQLTLLGPVAGTYTRPSILPMRNALAIEGYQVRRDKAFTDVSAKLQVFDNVTLAGDAGYPQYQSLDVVTEKPALIADVSESIVRAAEYVDNGFGPIAVETLLNYADFGQTISFHENRGSDLWRRRCWIHSLNGKQKAFWLPTFNQDLLLQSTIGSAATVVTVKSIGHVGYYAGKHVMILLNDGTRFFRAINSASKSGGNDLLTISSAIGQSVAVADIALFCFISKVRLNSDVVTIDHQFELASSVSIPVTEVPA